MILTNQIHFIPFAWGADFVDFACGAALLLCTANFWLILFEVSLADAQLGRSRLSRLCVMIILFACDEEKRSTTGFRIKLSDILRELRTILDIIKQEQGSVAFKKDMKNMCADPKHVCNERVRNSKASSDGIISESPCSCCTVSEAKLQEVARNEVVNNKVFREKNLLGVIRNLEKLLISSSGKYCFSVSVINCRLQSFRFVLAKSQGKRYGSSSLIKLAAKSIQK